MNSQFELLLDTLSQPNKLQAPRKLLAALKACPEIPSLPEPQESSLTLALMEYEREAGSAPYRISEFDRWLSRSKNFWARRAREYTQELATLQEDLEALAKAGVIDSGPSAFQLSPALLQHRQAIEAFCRSFEASKRRLWLAAVIGEWFLARELALEEAGDFVLLETQDRCEQLEGHWNCCLSCLYSRDETLAWEFVLDLWDQGPCRNHALEVLDYMDERWCPKGFELLKERAKQPGAEVHVFGLASLLLRYEYRREEVLELVRSYAWQERADLEAFFWLEHGSRLTVPALREALRLPEPELIHLLSEIDQAWSRRELREVVEEYDEEQPGEYCLAALIESRDEATSDWAFELWQQKHPGEKYERPGFLAPSEEVIELALKLRRIFEGVTQEPATDC